MEQSPDSSQLDALHRDRHHLLEIRSIADGISDSGTEALEACGYKVKDCKNLTDLCAEAGAAFAKAVDQKIKTYFYPLEAEIASGYLRSRDLYQQIADNAELLARNITIKLYVNRFGLKK